ncbi:hypothetical protein P43SY_006713 [Pythium insidiosum]|uniref:HELP domain-containing protein n=1 Tax=Pythium insidiosum TaxID=114742 RepID=A0AAD5MIM1_PYTIN|nr:hypothetical protein P43SY_006713 [Pythium insidiosum]
MMTTCSAGSRLCSTAKTPVFGDDQLVAVRPWQTVVANAAPSAPPTINPNVPAASLDLEWIYGFNSDLRGVVAYVSPGEIVFPAGSTTVVYDVIEHKQRFAFHHDDLVQCLAVHPQQRHILATGERGTVPKIAIWSTHNTTTTLSVVRGFHRGGVALLAWMPSGRTLVSIGQDPMHCVAVYQWELVGSTTSVEWSRPATLLYADSCGPEPIHACVVLSATQFVTAGRRHLFFWSRERDERYASPHALFYKRPGVLGRKAKVQTLLSLAAMPPAGSASSKDSVMLHQVVLAGTARGQILVFEGRNCVKVLHAHAAAVNVLHALPSGAGLLSGGKDGKVRIWSKRLEPGATFDVDALGSVAPKVRSLVSSPDGGAKLLVATAGAELYEIAASDGSNLHFGAMLCGHFGFELHGLAAHPTRRECVTAGDDRSIRVWDLSAHRQLRMAAFDAPSRCCAYSPDGSLVAIGEGADEDTAAQLPHARLKARLVNPNKQGAFAVLSEPTLAVKYEAKDSKKYIRNVAFSGDGLTLAVGSNDAFIYAYNTDDWASKGKCKARDTSAVLSSFDFSTTGEHIMANARNKGEMVFFESSSGVEITRIATLKDVEWLTTTCPFGWAVQGAWAATQSAFVELTAMARSQPATNARLLAVGDALGAVRLLRFPCVSQQSTGPKVQAAASAISRVAFTNDNAYVLAISQQERCLFQWRVEYEEEDAAATLGADGVTPTNGGLPELEYTPNSDDEAEVSHGEMRSAFDEAVASGDHEVSQWTDSTALAAVTSGAPNEALPVRPWMASAIAPAEGPDDKDPELSTVPSECLELEWVYGFRAHDARNHVLGSRAKSWIVYPAACVVVVLDTKLWLQRHFKQHSDEVTALALHSGARAKSSRSRPPTSATDDGEASTSASTSTSSSAASWLASLEIVASGQMGKCPVIHVWRLDTLEVLVSLRGFHRHGIAELRFNTSGQLLATVGLDPMNSLAIYDWQNNVLLASAATSVAPGRVLGLSFQPPPLDDGEKSSSASPTLLATVGVKSITFWRLSGRHLVKKDALLGKKGLLQTFLAVVFCGRDAIKDALLGKKGLLQTFLAVVFCGRDAIVGTTSGDLYRFKGLELASIIPAHTRSVAALYATPKAPYNVASGGRDGLVKLWSADLECLAEFAEFNPFKHAIRSIFWDVERNWLIVGTRGASLHVLSSLDGSPVVPKTPDGTPVGTIDGHSKRELHGLSICPAKERFCTTGDDAVLRVWDLARHIQVLAHELDTASRACAYSYDGDFIAVGLGGGASARRHKKDGSLLVFEDRGGSVELVYETRDTKQSISVVRYSPDGQSLVVGALDNVVYIYDVPNNYAKRAVFNKHKSWITHLDISSDSQYVRSNCGGFELLFADITTGSHVASASALRNQKWDTCSTVFNWSNQGVWPPVSGSPSPLQITACAASLPGTSQEISKCVLVAGTSHGRLHLFKFPCFVSGAGFKSYGGHHGAVAQIGFSGQGLGAHCVSVGRTDRCVFQWRKTRARMPEDPLGATVGNASVAKDLDDDADILKEGLFVPEAFVNIAPREIKPFLSAIIPPTLETLEPGEADGAAAKCQFQLEHAFGFRTADARNNAVYAKSKHVVFHTACLGVRYDRRTHTQQFYRGHTRPIVSLAASRDGSFVATGEICREHLQHERPRIHIWEPTSCAPIVVLSAFHTRAVSYLAFHPARDLLASVGQDEFHSLAIYSSSSGLWFDGALLASTRTTRAPVYFVTFIEDLAAPYHVVTGGKDHVIFWRLDAPTLVGTYGVFGAKAQTQSLLSGASLGSVVITGCLSGHLYVWESGVVSKAIPGHDGAVYALHATSQGCVSGGRDGHVKVWSKAMAPLADFNVHDAKPVSQNATVRSVFWDVAEDRVLIGTKGGEVLELSRLTSELSLVTESHFGHDELIALATHPQRPELVATAGDDQTVRVWDLERRQVVVKLTLDGALRSVAYSPDGKWLAVGFGSSSPSSAVNPTVGSSNNNFKDGAFMVLDAQTLEVLHEGRDCKQSIVAIQFSPDLTLLALGAADRCVYFYSTLDSFSLRFKFTKVAGRVLHLDFAADSSLLRVNSDAYELLFISTLDGSAITTPSTVKDTTWATHTCVFAWATQGIWDFAREDEFFHAIAKAHTLPLLAAATNRGEVRVYNFPCLSKRMEQHVLSGHSMNVSNVAFTCDDSRLVSIGSGDKSLLVWRISQASGTSTSSSVSSAS